MSVRLLEQLDLIADAPNGIQKLRGLILELAVRGKLVPQDPNDEPASDLLKRIAVAKARMEAEGQIKKSKAVPPVAQSEKPFEIPNGWEWSRLAAVSLINPRNAVDDSTFASFVPMAMIGTRFDGAHSQEHRKWAEIKQGFTHFAESDIGVAKITPCFENSKACVFENLQNEIGAGTTELHIVRPIDQTLVPRYVLAYLKAPMFLLVGETRMTGTAGQKRLPKEFLEHNPFPLPPLAEQHRIVAKVDELMALCDQMEAEQADAESAHITLVHTLLATLTQSPDAAELAASWQRLAEHFDTLFTTEFSLDALKQTVLQLAVMGKLVSQDPNDEPAAKLLGEIRTRRAISLKSGNPNPCEASVQSKKQEKQRCPLDLDELPRGWSWATLIQCAEIVVDCHNKTAPYTSKGIPLLRTTNIRNGSMNLKEPKFVSAETYERWSSRCKPRPGDILITREAPMGEVCIIPEGMTVCMGQRIMLIRLVDNTIVPRFLLYSLLEPGLME
ncbi:MAG: restriction endonuclease subunit S [Rhodobacteraceae bacterium]|nr:restriction endonuclease subunit S [Paracoccaceae bacterium]